MKIERVNNEMGETSCVVRWLVETPAGWVGAWDREAIEEFARASAAAERERIAAMLDMPAYLNGEAEDLSRATAAQIRRSGDSPLAPDAEPVL